MISRIPETVKDAYGTSYRLTKELSRGGQGVVYRTTIPDILVKLDFNGSEESGSHYMNLRLLPLPEGLHVTLPIVPLKGKQTGYIMRLLEDMVSFGQAFCKHDENEILAASLSNTPWIRNFFSPGQENLKGYGLVFGTLILNGGLRRIYKAYMEAAKILAHLHTAGLVYCDFSPNNVFISNDFSHSNVWLIDADNVGFAEDLNAFIFTPSYGAPEVQRGEYPCSIWADTFAFASAFFQQVTQYHPFEGALYEECLDDGEDLEEVEEKRNFGEFPYILDGDNDSNYREGECCDCLFPKNLLTLFQRTFGVGRNKRKLRPLMSEWAAQLAYALDGLAHCSNCGMDYFSEEPGKCSFCDSEQAICHVVSRLSNGYELWRVVREIRSGEAVSIPSRIAHGFRVDDRDEDIAFTLTIDGQKNIQFEKKSFAIEYTTPGGQNVTRYKARGSMHLQASCQETGIHTDVLIEIKE